MMSKCLPKCPISHAHYDPHSAILKQIVVAASSEWLHIIFFEGDEGVCRTKPNGDTVCSLHQVKLLWLHYVRVKKRKKVSRIHSKHPARSTLSLSFFLCPPSEIQVTESDLIPHSRYVRQDQENNAREVPQELLRVSNLRNGVQR